MLHAPGGGSIRRIAQLANENKIWLDNTWGTLPWFTPFEAGDYYTMYAVPEEFSAHRGGDRRGLPGGQGRSSAAATSSA